MRSGSETPLNLGFLTAVPQVQGRGDNSAREGEIESDLYPLGLEYCISAPLSIPIPPEQQIITSPLFNSLIANNYYLTTMIIFLWGELTLLNESLDCSWRLIL